LPHSDGQSFAASGPAQAATSEDARLRVLRIYHTLNQKTAIAFADYLAQRLPFQIQVIQTDNSGPCSAQPL
jgi:hypothetical protein